MKLSRILRDGPDGPLARVVGVRPDDGVVVDLRSAERLRLEANGASREAAGRLAAAVFPGSLTAALEGGPSFVRAGAAIEDPHDEAAASDRRSAVARCDRPPDDARRLRVRAAPGQCPRWGKREVPDLFYEVPVYYKMNPLTVIGHQGSVPWPGGAKFMDYELEIALVIGTRGQDLHPDVALDHVLGVTVMNDFSARDIQAVEMTAGFGPAKGKDFATSLGPWITTLDELDVEDLTMLARVNGEEWSRGSTATLTWSLAEIVAYMSRNEPVVPGQVIGSGTVGLGCGLELYRKLRPGDVVELEIEGIGTLRNRLEEPATTTGSPVPRNGSQVTLPTKEPQAPPSGPAVRGCRAALRTGPGGPLRRATCLQ